MEVEEEGLEMQAAVWKVQLCMSVGNGQATNKSNRVIIVHPKTQFINHHSMVTLIPGITRHTDKSAKLIK